MGKLNVCEKTNREDSKSEPNTLPEHNKAVYVPRFAYPQKNK